MRAPRPRRLRSRSSGSYPPPRSASSHRASPTASRRCAASRRAASAEKEAALACEAGAAPGIAALIAARAAHQMREYERRGQWLERAEGAGESLHAARLLTQAELALDERDFIGARDALRSLHGTGPRHIATARMQLRAERGAQNWEEVLRLATLLGQPGALPPANAQEHPVQAHLELRPPRAGDRGSLDACLRRIPAEDLAHPRVASAAARRAAARGDRKSTRLNSRH